jgi:hypothetical protein
MLLAALEEKGLKELVLLSGWLLIRPTADVEKLEIWRLPAVAVILAGVWTVEELGVLSVSPCNGLSVELMLLNCSVVESGAMPGEFGSETVFSAAPGIGYLLGLVGAPSEDMRLGCERACALFSFSTESRSCSDVVESIQGFCCLD